MIIARRLATTFDEMIDIVSAEDPVALLLGVERQGVISISGARVSYALPE
jgi:hypothetical protein